MTGKYAGRPHHTLSTLPDPTSQVDQEVVFIDGNGLRTLLYSDGKTWKASSGTTLGGASTITDLTDYASANLPALNTPLATALATKAPLQVGALVDDNTKAPNAQAVLNAIAAGGGGGVSTIAATTDKATVDLPAINTPLATALLSKLSAAAGAVDTVNLAPRAVGAAQLAAATTKTYLGRSSTGTGDVEQVPVATLKADLGVDQVPNYPVASDAEAQAGVSSQKMMTPAKTALAIAALAPAGTQGPPGAAGGQGPPGAAGGAATSAAFPAGATPALDLTRNGGGTQYGRVDLTQNLTLGIAASPVTDGNWQATLVGAAIAYTVNISAYLFKGPDTPSYVNGQPNIMTAVKTPVGKPLLFCSLGELIVSTPAPVFSAQSAPAGTIGVAYSYTFVASNTTSFAVASGSIPAGLSLNTGTGVLSGTPTTAATSTFTVSATGAGGTTASTSQSVMVSAALVGRADNFNRADAATPGTPSDGGSAWSTFSGNAGIYTNQLYIESDGGVQLSTDLTAATFQVTFLGAGRPGLRFRVGASDYWALHSFGNSGDYTLRKSVGGVVTDVLQTSGINYDNVSATVSITWTATQITSFTIGGVTPSFFLGALPVSDTDGAAGTSIQLFGGGNYVTSYFDDMTVA